jgi:hypothetical protein
MSLIDIAALALDAVEGAIEDELAREGAVSVSLASTCLTSATYSADGVLSVVFTDGSQFDYPPGSVSQDEYYNLVTAHSVGRYFNTYIRGR